MPARQLVPLACRLVTAQWSASSPAAASIAALARSTTSGTEGRSLSSSSSSSSSASDHVDRFDRIILSGLKFHGYHGAIPEEQVLGQKFVVDAVLFCDLSRAGQSDELRDTVNYAEVYSTVQQVVEGPHKQLLESVAHTICQQVLDSQPLVAGVQLAVKKPHVSLPGAFDHLGIQITRWRHASS